MSVYRRLSILFTFTAIIWASTTQAAVDLFVWNPDRSALSILIPTTDGQTPQEAVEAYSEAFQKDPHLAKLATPEFIRLLESPAGHFENFQHKDSKILAGVNANKTKDLTSPEERILYFQKVLQESGARVLVIPPAIEIAMNERDKTEFHQRLNDHLHLMVSLGGNDIHPSLYGEKVTHAVETNLTLDRIELQRVKSFKASERGLFFGICRGHQVGAVADGHTLYQDLEKDQQAARHKHVGAEKSFPGVQTWHWVNVENSLLSRMLRQDRAWTNSIHHQAVRVNPEGLSFPIAHSDNIVEGLQSRNGLGLSLQFHPEIRRELSGDPTYSSWGAKLLKSVVSYARLVRMQTRSFTKCAQLFEN